MNDERADSGAGRPPRFEEIEDPEFQKRWKEARHLSEDEVERAFRHGFDARDRFAERPFREVEGYLRESWAAMAPPVDWDQVADIIRSGYERYQGAGFGSWIESSDEALRRFPDRTIGGSAIGGTMGERSFLGGAEPVSDFEGEGGPPVEDGRRIRDEPDEPS